MANKDKSSTKERRRVKNSAFGNESAQEHPRHQAERARSLLCIKNRDPGVPDSRSSFRTFQVG
jgi:hypothetical protein